MKDWLPYFVIGALATWRLALLFSKESGPGKIFMKLRRLPAPRSSAREGLSCPFCMSVWFATAITTYYWWLGIVHPYLTPVYSLGLSAVAVALNQKLTKGPL